MKFNRREPYCYIAHFKCLAAMIIAYVLGLKFLKKNRTERTVMMYSHSLSGNIKAFFDYTLKNPNLPYKTFYTTIDKQEYKKLHENYGDKIMLATKISVIRKILNAGVMMTSHGPGIFYPLKWLSPRTGFVDVWHGITGLKGQSPEDIGRMRFYSEFFVSSEYFKEIYIKQFQLEPHQVIVTGHSRVDRFYDPDGIAKRVRRELHLTNTKYIILFAPTYRPRGESGEIPFRLSASEFFGRLNNFCEKIDATLIVRLHINSKLRTVPIDYSRVRVIPQKEYPETNELLTVVDLVITDWSSIACDFYVLGRPVVYVDNPTPSTHQPAFQNIERVGDHVYNIDELAVVIEKNLKLNKNTVRDMLSDILNKCYGNTLDGCSAQRYDMAIRKLLQIK